MEHRHTWKVGTVLPAPRFGSSSTAYKPRQRHKQQRKLKAPQVRQTRHETIRNWVLHFGKVMEKYAKTIQPHAKGIWNADETLIRTKKAKMDYEYVWNVIDNETKFLLASVNSGKTRSRRDAAIVMRDAWAQNGVHPSAVVTDRLPSYSGGIHAAFNRKGGTRKVQHISILGRRRLINNNAVESHHTHQKEFHKVRRGVNEVQQYQDGFKVFHNFVRKGVKDKQTPAERCGIGIEGKRWETMLTASLKDPRLTKTAEAIKSPAS